MDATTFLAWLGAITGTTALVWDFYKWRLSGAKLRVSVGLDFTVDRETNSYTKEQFAPPNPYLIVKIINGGQAKTIVERLEIVIYENRKKKRNYDEKARLIYYHTHLGNLPITLEPAQRWVGAIPQSAELEYSIENEFVYLEVHDTFNRRPRKVRIRRYVAEALFGSFISKAIPLDHKASIGAEVIQEPRYRVETKPMSKGELWRVVVHDRTLKNTMLSGGRTYQDNLSQDEAVKLADALRGQLNPSSQEPTA